MDVYGIAFAIAAANKHSDPDAYANEVVARVDGTYEEAKPEAEV